MVIARPLRVFPPQIRGQRPSLAIAMSLLRLPDELIHHCSFRIVALDPLGPLIPLALICRAFDLVVSSQPEYVTLCST